MTAATPAALFPGQSFTPPQSDLIARLLVGDDLRAWDVGHRSLLPLIHRGVVDCEATTNRLYLLTPPARDRRRATLRRQIAALSTEVDDIVRVIDAATQPLAAVEIRLQTEEINVRNLVRALAAAMGTATAAALGRNLAAAHAELFAAREDVRRMLHADLRRRQRLDEVSGTLRDMRRELARLDMAAGRERRA